jgi:hypothetical protein
VCVCARAHYTVSNKITGIAEPIFVSRRSQVQPTACFSFQRPLWCSPHSWVSLKHVKRPEIHCSIMRPAPLKQVNACIILWHTDPLLGSDRKKKKRQRPLLGNTFVNTQQHCRCYYEPDYPQQWKYCWKRYILCGPLRVYITRQI